MDGSETRASILVVDDTVENLRLLSTLLTEQQYEVRPVTSGRLALQAIQHAPPDLVLLDVNMPEMNGYEVCARIRELGFSDLPVIFLTALGETQDKLRAFEAGGADYVTKPFQIEELIARVKVHLSLQRARLELTRKHERLRELERLRDDLVHMVVHDLRSPLTVLLFNLEFVAEGARDVLDPGTMADLNVAIEAASGLTRMTNDLLDVSRLEDGHLPIERAPGDLAAIATEVGGRLASLDRARTIEIDRAGPVEGAFDGGLLRRVVENLVSNAVKHTPAGSRIRVVPRRLGDRVRLAIHDEGPGVPAEAKSRIFEKFGTVAARRENQFHSAGLGLTFCKLAVEAHGGRIGVDDGDPVGSVFWFELPAS